MGTFTADALSGLTIGFLAAIALYVAWFLRSGYANPWLIFTGFWIGAAIGLLLGLIVFMFFLGMAFQPRP